MNSNSVSVSAAIISKNEEHCIKSCLDSLTGKFNEIIVVDTGSTDRTIEIIKNHSSCIKLFSLEWQNSFSAPRNLAIKKSKCNYIFFIDCDEILKSSKREVNDWFLTLDKNPARDHTILCPQIVDHTGDTSHTIRRGFRNNGELKYYGFVHEEIRSSDNHPLSDIRAELIINHSGYMDSEIDRKNKKTRNESLNKMNITFEPHHLRWQYFYYRDSFQSIQPEILYTNLKKMIVNNNKDKISIYNLKNDSYSFSIIDLLARAKLLMMELFLRGNYL